MARLPPGSPMDAESAKELISSTLTRAAENLDRPAPPYSVRAFISSNGDVDGELIVHGFRRGESLKPIVDDLMFGMTQNLPGMWISVGVRYAAPEGVKSPDYRYRGLSEAMTYYRKSDPTGTLSVFLTERNILENLKRKKRPKPEQIIIRLHWNKQNAHPGKMPERHRRTFPKK